MGQTFFNTAAPAGMNFYACTATNVWTQQTQPTLPGLTGQSGKVLTTDGNTASWLGFSGDVSGTAGALTVVGLRSYPVAATNPADGQVLKWSAAASQWQPGTPSIALAGDATGAAGSTLVKALKAARWRPRLRRRRAGVEMERGVELVATGDAGDHAGR